MSTDVLRINQRPLRGLCLLDAVLETKSKLRAHACRMQAELFTTSKHKNVFSIRMCNI